MRFNRIYRIGLEVEGGWNRAPTYPGCTMASDMSVTVSGYTAKEAVSLPLASIDEGKAFLRGIYPHAVNNTCGFHVHFSFINPADYARLMDKIFFDFWLDEVRKWGLENQIRNKNFWHRLSGQNTYCKRVHQPDAQSIQTGKGTYRYAHWNFCYKFHKTVECRMMPTFKNVATAEKALEFLVNTVEKFLESAPEQIGYRKIITE